MSGHRRAAGTTRFALHAANILWRGFRRSSKDAGSPRARTGPGLGRGQPPAGPRRPPGWRDAPPRDVGVFRLRVTWRCSSSLSAWVSTRHHRLFVVMMPSRANRRDPHRAADRARRPAPRRWMLSRPSGQHELESPFSGAHVFRRDRSPYSRSAQRHRGRKPAGDGPPLCPWPRNSSPSFVGPVRADLAAGAGTPVKPAACRYRHRLIAPPPVAAFARPHSPAPISCTTRPSPASAGAPRALRNKPGQFLSQRPRHGPQTSVQLNLQLLRKRLSPFPSRRSRATAFSAARSGTAGTERAFRVQPLPPRPHNPGLNLR